MQNMADVSHLTYCKTSYDKICKDVFTFALNHNASVGALRVLVRPVGVAFIHLQIKI